MQSWRGRGEANGRVEIERRKEAGSLPTMPAPWEGKHGAKRIQAEFQHMCRSIAEGNMPQVHNLRLVDDNLFQWRFELKNFDEDMPGGKALNKDLEELREKHGQDHVLMEILFEEQYPTVPFFLRVVSPRCQWYTGHVRKPIRSLVDEGNMDCHPPAGNKLSLFCSINNACCEVQESRIIVPEQQGTNFVTQFRSLRGSRGGLKRRICSRLAWPASSSQPLVPCWVVLTAMRRAHHHVVGKFTAEICADGRS